jgi:hypothetical protein
VTESHFLPVLPATLFHVAPISVEFQIVPSLPFHREFTAARYLPWFDDVIDHQSLPRPVVVTSVHVLVEVHVQMLPYWITAASFDPSLDDTRCSGVIGSPNFAAILYYRCDHREII